MTTRSRLPRRARRDSYFEFLEERMLLSATVANYSVPNSLTQLAAYDSTGNLWVVDESTDTFDYTLDQISNQHVVNSISLDGTDPVAIAAGANGHIWIADGNGGLDDVDTVGESFTPHLFVSDTFDNPQDVPVALTVTPSGTVWFTGQSMGATSTENVVGRYVPSSDAVSYMTLDSSTSDASANYISANGADGAWVGMPGTDFSDHVGANHLVDLSFSGTITASYYAVQTLTVVPASAGADAATADAGNPISGIASDGSGGVWFSLANSTSTTAPHGADRIVHGVFDGGSLDQTAFVLPDVTAGTPLSVANITLDSSGKLWFNETNGTNAGYFDTVANSFNDPSDPISYPSSAAPFSHADLTVNPAGTQATFVALDNSSLVEIDLPAATPPTFSGSAPDIHIQEKTALPERTLACFMAPAPGTGSYSAVIAWGDGTTSTVPVTPVPGVDNSYAVMVSGKSFASQGTYCGTITIVDSANVQAGVIDLKSIISDTPLNLTSFNTFPLILRIATATATFTDDPGRAASSFTATINWGDGTSSTGLIVADPTQAGRYIVIALHQYRRKGTYTATITVITSELNALVNVNTASSNLTV